MSLSPEAFLQKIENRTARVGVVGLGYVGLPLILEFVEKGFPVLGLDIDQAKVDSLHKGETYIKHIPSERIAEGVKHGLKATTDFSQAATCDAILMCVPTPLTKNREPDMTYIEKTCEALAPYVRPNQLQCLESTTYPGTTDEVVKPILEKSGLKAGVDFFLAYSPEREDPSNPNFTTATIPKVVGGHTEACLKVATALYSQVVVQAIPVSSCAAAEAAKILENTFRCINIAMVNELKMVFDRMGLDVWEIIDAAATKPFGYMKFTPGPGLGGHCIPIDPYYLTWKARAYDIPTRFIEMAGEINTYMPYYVVQKLVDGLSMRGQGIKDAKVLIMGLAYKKNVDDDRESPTYKLIDILEKYGAKVDFHDPFIPVIRPSREHGQYAGRKSVDVLKAGEYDVVLVSTNHDGVDYDALLKSAKLIVDSRGVYKAGTEKVIQA